MKNDSIFSIVVESKQTKARLAGSVEILYNGESQSGLFGDETKDIFTDWGKDIMGWEFQNQVTLSVVNFNGFYFAPTSEQALEVKVNFFCPGEKKETSWNRK